MRPIPALESQPSLGWFWNWVPYWRLESLGPRVGLGNGSHLAVGVPFPDRVPGAEYNAAQVVHGAGGVTDAETVEVFALIGLNTMSTYVNSIANTTVDYPAPEELDMEERE